MLRRVLLGAAFYSICSSAILALPAGNEEVVQQFAQAQRMSAEGKIDEAIAIYQALIKSNPLLPEAYNNLAALYLKQNKTGQAKYILEQGLHAHKGYGVLYESLTAINVAMARQAYSKALQIDAKSNEISIATLSLDKDALQGKRQPIVISKEQTADKQKNETQPAVVKAEATKNDSVDEKEVVAAITSGAIKRDPVEDVLKLSATPSLDSPETVLHAWSAAWSAKAVDVYLSFYHKHYKPENGLSRKSWEQARRYRINKPRWIKVSLSDLNITRNTGKQAVISFKQAYRSNSFRDVSNKQMVLINTNEGWRIYREKSL